MKIDVLRGFCLGEGRDAFPGETLDLDDKKALYLIARGKAVPAGTKVKTGTVRNQKPVKDTEK